LDAPRNRSFWAHLDYLFGIRITVRLEAATRKSLGRIVIAETNSLWSLGAAYQKLQESRPSPALSSTHGIEATCVDATDTHHLIRGLSRENINSILNRDVSTLPRGAVPLMVGSNIAMLFAEMDMELEKQFPPSALINPVASRRFLRYPARRP
jgi:hypothetical protein